MRQLYHVYLAVFVVASRKYRLHAQSGIIFLK